MSFNFTVQNVIDFPDGEYTAQINNVSSVDSEYGNYFQVDFNILHPNEFQGSVFKQNYKIEHQNQTTRNIAIKSFSNFCMEIGGLKIGEEPKELDFLLKVVKILIKNNIGKDGRNYANVVRIELAEKILVEATQLDTISQNSPTTVQYGGISIPQEQPVSNQPLNDEVPF
jgi:hypothetical protein